MQGYLDGASQLSSVDSVQVDPTLSACDQQVVFAWMQIETMDSALV